MRSKIVLRPPHLYGLVYGKARTAALEDRVRLAGPPGADGPRKKDRQWTGGPWEHLLASKDPLFFQHMIPLSLRRSWEMAVLAAVLPTSYVSNEGFGFWHRVAYVVAGDQLKEALMDV